MPKDGQLAPDWFSPPGDTIADILRERGISEGEFAQRMGKSTIGGKAILEGREPLTVDIAIKLSRWLGGSVEFWMTRETQYQEDKRRRRPKSP